jgi:hypothetical protein
MSPHTLSAESHARRVARTGSAGSARSAQPAAEDLSALTPKELRARLKEAGLATSGKKAELVARLQAA